MTEHTFIDETNPEDVPDLTDAELERLHAALRERLHDNLPEAGVPLHEAQLIQVVQTEIIHRRAIDTS